MSAAKLVATVVLALITSTSVWGSGGETLGTLDDTGRFLPKVRILKEGSSIIVSKVDPGERFDSVRIRFIFTGSARANAMRDLFIQWEKQPEQWGKLWRIDGHRGFRREDRLFTAPWNSALSFVVLDRSPDRRLQGVAWDRAIQMWLDGQPLRRPPASKQVASAPARLTHFDDDGNAVRPAQGVAMATGAPPPPVAPTIDKTAQQALERKYQDLTDRLNRVERSVDTAVDKGLEKKYYEVRDRIMRLEQSLTTAQRWSFWGPLLSLSLAIIFSSVAIFWAFVRLHRGPGPGAPSALNDPSVRFPSDRKFRRT